MSVIYGTAEAAASFAGLLVLFRLYRNALHTLCIDDSRGSLKQDLLWSSAGALLVCLCRYLPFLPDHSMLILAVYFCITGRWIYKAHHIVLFSMAGFCMLCFKGFEFVLSIFFSLFFGGYQSFLSMLLSDGIFRTAVLCVKMMLWCALSAILCKYLIRIRISRRSTCPLLVFSCAGCIGFVYLSVGIFELYTSVVIRVWLFFVIAAIAAAFTIYFCITEYAEEQKTSEMLEMRNSLLNENYKMISSIYTSQAKLYHDMNNHLNALYQMLDDNKINDAKAYIEKINGPVANLSKTAWTGIDLVDIILNSKIEKILEKGRSPDINIEFPRNSDIQPHDLCTILGNLIDNAMEAAEKSYLPGEISICIRKINHFVIVQVSNPCAGNKGTYTGLPDTSKKDVTLHGWGLASVSDAVKKYHGTLKCKNENDRFIVTAMLFFRNLPDKE